MFASLSRIVRPGGIAVFLALVLAAEVGAQDFKVIKPTIPERAARTMRYKVVAALRDTAAFNADKQTVEDYFTKYYFPVMTGTSTGDLAELGRRREDLIKLLRGAGSEQAQTFLTSLTGKGMISIAMGNYHPAVRYNAVLILGMLDEKYSKGVGTNVTRPVPLAQSTSALLILLENDEYRGVYIPPSLKAGALVGLIRHARFGMTRENVPKATQAATALIAQTELPKDMKPEVYSWMKKLAAELLLRLHAEAPTAEVQGAINSLVAEGVSLDDRCEVAGLMKVASYGAAQGVDGPGSIAALGKLAGEVLDEEAKVSEEYLDELRGAFRGMTPGRGGYGGGYGGGRGEDTGPDFERRRVLARLVQIRSGARSLAEGLDDDSKQKLGALVELFGPVITTAVDKDSQDQDVATSVIQAQREVARLVKEWKPDGAAEEESPLAASE